MRYNRLPQMKLPRRTMKDGGEGVNTSRFAMPFYVSFIFLEFAQRVTKYEKVDTYFLFRNVNICRFSFRTKSCSECRAYKCQLEYLINSLPASRINFFLDISGKKLRAVLLWSFLYREQNENF